MAVHIPSDLVVDVMRAAEPARVQAAARKLSATSTAVAAADFNQALAAVAPSQEEAPAGTRISPAGAKPDAYAQFESFMLRDAFESMMPKENNEAYGAGYAGSVWRSMAAEQYASIFTARGGLGIAEMLRQRAPATPAVPAGDGQWPYFPRAAS